MITNTTAYLDYQEACGIAAAELRNHIERQTLDTSARGRSVRGAYRLYASMAGRAARQTDDLYRFMWSEAYRQQRKLDRDHDKRVARFAKQWIGASVELLTNPRRIDDLVAPGWDDEVSVKFVVEQRNTA